MAIEQRVRRPVCAVALVIAAVVAGCGDIQIPGSQDSGGSAAADESTPPATCEFGNDAQCDDGDSCTTDECLITGVCSHAPLANGCKIDGTCYADGAAAAGNACQTCSVATSKTRWTPLPCDDGKPCTRDECTASSGCVYLADDALPCDDGVACTSDDHCAAGVCVATPCACDTDEDCSGKLEPAACQAAVCESGGCVVRPDPKQDGDACDDVDACTTSDVCASGVCAGTRLACATGAAPCTAVSCADGACDVSPLAPGASCAPLSTCVTGATCTEGGNCTGSWDTTACPCTTNADCDDGLSCSVGLCAAKSCTFSVAPGYCRILDACADAGTPDPADACRVCDPTRDAEGWSALDCDDGNPCTDDTCDAASGCVHTPGGDGNACDAGACAATGVCSGGTCTPGATAPMNGKVCDDGLFCTTGETCSDGVCGNGTPTDCSVGGDGNCLVGACDEDADACVGEPIPSGTACNDDDACTDSDECADGVCAGVAKVCPGTVDACHATTCVEGVCGTAILTGESCDDGKFCTKNDACNAAGACVGEFDDAVCGCAQDASCSYLTDACHTGRCNTFTGECGAEPTPGLTCDDGNGCTFNDRCDPVGECAGTAYVCTGTPCEASECDGTGQCTTSLVPGKCLIDLGGASLCLDAQEASPSTTCLVCDPTTSQTTWTPALNGVSCGQTTAGDCEKPGVCDAGVCSSGLQPAGTPCGDQSTSACDGPNVCNAAGTCLPASVSAGTPCDDGNPNNVLDACDGAGKCAGTKCTASAQCASPPSSCYSAVGTCALATGACSYVPKDSQTACDDGDPLTLGDRCNGAGTCVGTPPCTVGSCTTPSGPCESLPGTCDQGTGLCSYTNKPVGTPCDDLNPATLDDRCASGGVCSGTLNTPPWITTIPRTQALTGATLPAIRFFAGEGSNPAEALQHLTVTVISSTNPQVLPASGVAVVCQDLGAGCVGALTSVGKLGPLGTTTLTLQASDGVTTAQTSFDVEVVGCPVGSQTMTATGDFTLPPDCRSLTIQAWGGGGGAGALDGPQSSGYRGGDGGGGGFAEVRVAPASSAVYHVVVGGGGEGGACGSPVAGGAGTYAGGTGGAGANGGTGEGAGAGGAGGVATKNGKDGGAGGYGGGGGGAGSKNGGGGGGATVVTDLGGVEVVIAGGGGGGGGANSPDSGAPGGNGGGGNGASVPSGSDAGAGGGGGASVGQTTSPASGLLPVPPAPDGAATGASGVLNSTCSSTTGASGAAVFTYSGLGESAGLVVEDGSAFEGEVLTLHVRVTRLDAAQPVTFKWATQGLSARAGIDFVAAGGLVSLPVGTDVVTLAIETADNDSLDGLRLLEVAVTELVNVEGVDTTALGLIGDDETCAAGEPVLDPSGEVLLGMAGRFTDLDDDGYTGPAVPACVLVGHAPPSGFFDAPNPPPRQGWNAKTVAEVQSNNNERSWSGDVDARVEAGYASATNLDLGRQTTSLRLTDWGLAIPTTATVRGLRVHVVRSMAACTAGSISDAGISLVLAGVAVGADRSTTEPWPTTPAEAVYGAPKDLWGTSLTAAQVNSATFGVAVRAGSQANNCEARVHHVWVEVFVSEGEDCAPNDKTRWLAKDLYVDQDADLYGASTVPAVCMGDALPAAYATGYSRTSFGVDCYDANANAFPGQSAYFTTQRGDGSFDYNCDGSSVKQTTTCDTCTCSLSGNCSAFTGGTCVKGAAQVNYSCSVLASTACGASVAKGTCSIRHLSLPTSCLAVNGSITTGSGTQTTYCSANYAGYGNRDGVLSDDVTYVATTCGCQ